MIRRLLLSGFVLATFGIVAYVALKSQPSFNGTAPGCGPSGGCHTFQSGIVGTTRNGMNISVTLSGGSGSVAGELVDSTGTVVVTNNSTSSNPFVLVAPRAGRFTVNAGYKNPQRRWDSTQVLITVTDVKESPEAPTGFRLDQNYPNPFNPSTTIAYYLPVSAHVQLSIFDDAGRQVAVLVEGWQHSGPHHIVWDASGVSSGVYFYRLQAGRLAETRKLVVVR